TGGSVGIGFAIPADVAEQVTGQLIRHGKIERGYIGATIQNFTTEMAEAQGMGDQKGAIVSDLVPGGPSQKAGLMPGDVVIAVDGHPVTTSSELTREVAKAHPGDILHLNVIRDGHQRTVDIRAGERPSEAQLSAEENGPGEEGQGPSKPSAPAAPEVLGMRLAPLDDVLRRQLGLPPSVHGAVITSVDESSDAGDKGLRRGDVIVRAGDRNVASAADVQAVVAMAKKAGRPSVLVGVYRGGRTLFLPLKIGK
ncbi:MAG: PDZ domain-containing protein, partial [Alphaproteobacteria bacterium]|nr:PDZ domain-containing protein [Alphaproteobacteria bacterium]